MNSDSRRWSESYGGRSACAYARCREGTDANASMRRIAYLLTHDERRERPHVRLRHHKQSHQPSQRQAMEEHITQNFTFMPIPLCCSRRDDDTLRIDHLAHDTAGAV